MPTVVLTDVALRRLKAPPGQRVDYFDAAFPGLALRVTGAADRRPERRHWTLFYRFGGKQRRLTFEPGTRRLDWPMPGLQPHWRNNRSRPGTIPPPPR